MKTRTAAIIVAAGQATRFGAPKVISQIAGVPAILRVIQTFQSVPAIEQIVVVVGDDVRAKVEDLVANVGSRPPIALVPGGERRQDSVLAGIKALPDAEFVVVHDAARPLVTSHMIEAAIAALEAGAEAAIAAVPVTDTIKRQRGTEIETIDRSDLWRAQTPQAFRRASIARELEKARQDDIAVTDEATLIERAGGRVVLVPGSDQNLKLTVPGDRTILEALMSADTTEPPYRTGIGYDVHRLVAGRPLVLGGVQIPSELGLEGHSDADVLLHAISDALLGACAIGDIGQHFPPTDSQYCGISSLILLERVRDLIAERGYAVVNIDATVIAEAPRIGPHVSAMQLAISSALQLPENRIGIKATTNEGIGFAGRREGIAAVAVATVSNTG